MMLCWAIRPQWVNVLWLSASLISMMTNDMKINISYFFFKQFRTQVKRLRHIVFIKKIISNVVCKTLAILSQPQYVHDKAFGQQFQRWMSKRHSLFSFNGNIDWISLDRMQCSIKIGLQHFQWCDMKPNTQLQTATETVLLCMRISTPHDKSKFAESHRMQVKNGCHWKQ